MDPNDLSVVSAAPVTVTVDGVDYKIGPLKVRELGLLQAWIKEQVPHPIEAVKGHLGGLPEPLQIALLEGARKDAYRWPPKLNSPEANTLLAGEEGEKELVHLIFTKHQPSLTRADTDAIAGKLGLDDFKRVAEVAFGKGPDAPKSAGAAADAPA